MQSAKETNHWMKGLSIPVTKLPSTTPGTTGAIIAASSNDPTIVLNKNYDEQYVNNLLASRKKTDSAIDNAMAAGLEQAFSAVSDKLSANSARIKEVAQALLNTLNARLAPIEALLIDKFGKEPMANTSFFEAAKLGYLKFGNIVIDWLDEIQVVLQASVFDIGYDISGSKGYQGVKKYLGLANTADLYTVFLQLDNAAFPTYVPAPFQILGHIVVGTDGVTRYIQGAGDLSIILGDDASVSTTAKPMPGAHAKIAAPAGSTNKYVVIVGFERSFVRAYSPSAHLLSIASRVAVRERSATLTAAAVVLKLLAKYAEKDSDRQFYLSDRDVVGTKIAEALNVKTRNVKVLSPSA